MSRYSDRDPPVELDRIWNIRMDAMTTTHLKLTMKTVLIPMLLCVVVLAATGLRAADDI
jgi:hypothetical protein